MPKASSRAKIRNQTLSAHWSTHPDTLFHALGLDHETLMLAQNELVGHIVLPGDPTYDTDRLLSNPVFSPAPSMIVYCAAEPDVAIALKLAISGNMPFTVRSGGHCTAGYSGGYGVMIDMSMMNGVFVDGAKMQATVEAGCNFGKLNKTLAGYKVQGGARLHVPAGECEDVCVGGFVQGGGLGFTSTTFGMNCDNALSMKVMLADGTIVVADPTQNYDLWWAMRGGTGGNFGVLLSVVYGLYPLGPVLGFSVAWDVSTPAGIAQAVNVLMMMQTTYMAGSAYAPNLNLQLLVVWQTIIDPAKPPLPSLVPVFMVRGLYVGDIVKAGPQSMQPLVAMPGAVVQFVQKGKYDSILDILLSNPQDQPIIDPKLGMPNEGKASRYVSKPLTGLEWAEILNYFTTQSPSTMSYMYLELYGGKIAAYPATESAFVHRDVLYNAVLDVFWYRPDDRAAAEVFMAGWTALFAKVGDGGSYQNYPSVSVPDYPIAYWGQAVHGLVKVKQKYDPGHFFTFAQAVPPKVTPEISSQPIPPKVAAALAQPIHR